MIFRIQPLLEARPGWDTIFFFFFLTHVLITVLWHSQMILPAKLYPQCLRDLTKTYSKDWQDPLNFSQKTPVWYLSIIYCEVGFQLPFHFVAIYVFWTGSHYHPWFRWDILRWKLYFNVTRYCRVYYKIWLQRIFSLLWQIRVGFLSTNLISLNSRTRQSAY